MSEENSSAGINLNSWDWSGNHTRLRVQLISVSFLFALTATYPPQSLDLPFFGKQEGSFNLLAFVYLPLISVYLATLTSFILRSINESKRAVSPVDALKPLDGNFHETTRALRSISKAINEVAKIDGSIAESIDAASSQLKNSANNLESSLQATKTTINDASEIISEFQSIKPVIQEVFKKGIVINDREFGNGIPDSMKQAINISRGKDDIIIFFSNLKAFTSRHENIEDYFDAISKKLEDASKNCVSAYNVCSDYSGVHALEKVNDFLEKPDNALEQVDRVVRSADKYLIDYRKLIETQGRTFGTARSLDFWLPSIASVFLFIYGLFALI